MKKVVAEKYRDFDPGRRASGSPGGTDAFISQQEDVK